MPSFLSQTTRRASGLPDGMLLCPSALLHLGSRAVVDQAKSRLARKGELMRISQSASVQPIQTRFSSRLPTADKVLACPSTL